MHKRNKKNRQKHPNPTPPQQKKDELEKQIEERKDEELDGEIEFEMKENAPCLKDEAAPEETIIVEKIIEAEEFTPAKPKRNKPGNKNKSNYAKEDIEKYGNTKGNDEIKDIGDNKEYDFVRKEIIEEVPAADDIVSKMQESDLINREENIKTPENVIPAARKKKGKHNKDATDKMTKGIHEEHSQNLPTCVQGNDSATVSVMDEEKSKSLSKTEHIVETPCVISKKSGNKKKNRNIQKTYIESTEIFEKTDTAQDDDKSNDEVTEIKQIEENKKENSDKTNKAKQEAQPKSELDSKGETFLVPVDKKNYKSVSEHGIQENIIETEINEMKEIKKKEPTTKSQKNKGKNKNKQAESAIIKDTRENTKEYRDSPLEIIVREDSSLQFQVPKISQTDNKNNNTKKIESRSRPGDIEQSENADMISSGIDFKSPSNITSKCDSEKDEIKKESVLCNEEILESRRSVNYTKEMKELIEFSPLSSEIQTARLELDTLPPLPEDDNNNVLENNSDLVEEIVNKEFERLLTDSSEPVLSMEEIPKAKQQTDESNKVDTANYTTLSESNIDESYKKLFEALLVEDAAVGGNSSTQTITSPKRDKQFIIQLFNKSVDVKTESQFVNKSKTETTDLKGKVMEVNKDMEDLKLSIEKSLSELTAMEAEEIPELVTITDYGSPSIKTDKEIMMVEDVGKKTTISESILSITSTSLESKQLSGGSDVKDSIESKTKDTLAKKNKGKGKCSKPNEKNHQNIEVKTGIQEIIKEEYLQNKRKSTEPHLDTLGSINQCSAPKNRETAKGKNIKNKEKDEQTNIQLDDQDISQITTYTQQLTKNQECKDILKPSEMATESKSSEKSESETSRSTKKDTETKESQGVYDHTLTDGMNSNHQEDDTLFDRKCAGNISTQLSTSFLLPLEKDMIFDHGQEPYKSKLPEESQVENPTAARSKNLLGPQEISVTSSKTDFKKEKNKNLTPNSKSAKVKVKDSDGVDNEKCSKHSQTENKIKKRSSKSNSPESEDEEIVYQYSFRKVFLTNCCNICNTELKGKRFACEYCNLIFYCSQNHKDQDWPQHQNLCFAVSTLVHLKGLRFIYGDAAGCSGQEYRLLRMQVIVSCEKILKRKLQPCEQEALLYPRMCAEPGCREWESAKLEDCEGCGLAAYCIGNPEHMTKEHRVWCKSYRLYHKLVTHQQSQGRLEPKMPSKVICEVGFRIPNKMNELLALVYEEKIDMDDVHYAALTQLATAPLTAAYSYQMFKDSLADLGLHNGHQRNVFVLHVVGAELQFEADTLNKWEVFFLHIRPDIREMRIVFVGPELNPSKLPLGLLAKIRMCKQCRHDKRKIILDYQDGQLYHNYAASRQFLVPDIVCAFNPGLHRKTGFGGLDSWPQTINSIIKLKVPFCVTSYTKFELPQDMGRIRQCSENEFQSILEPTLNPFASIRPDRNFISDDEMPLIYKNYCVMVLCGV